MPLKSKAQIATWERLVKEGKISEDTFKEAMGETKNPHKLPERVTPKKKMGIKNIRTTRVK